MGAEQNLLMPKLGLTMTEGTVAQWCVAPGAAFDAGAVIVVVESEKVSFDVEAPAAGVLDRILVNETETVAVGTPIAIWRSANATSKAAIAEPPQPAAAVPPPKPAQVSVSVPKPPASLQPGPTSGRKLATPLARRLARSGGIDLAPIAGSGPRGRVQARDVEMILASPSEAKMASAAASLPGHSIVTKPTSAERTMADRVSAAKREIPHFYLTVDIEVSAMTAFRAQLNAMAGRPKITITHLLVAAAVEAIRANPSANRVWTDGSILSFDQIDVGLAVVTDRGLTNPVVRNLGGDSFYALVAKVDAVVGRARKGALRAGDFGGGALTISNAGMHRLKYMSSIIVPDQSLILGIGGVQDCFRPDASDSPVLRREMGVTLSADHRVHIGTSALAFLATFEKALSEPVSLLARFQ